MRLLMEQIGNTYCPNKDCKEYGLRGQGNISVRGKYGKEKNRTLLYCLTCGKRFSSCRGTPFFGLKLSDDKIHQIVHHAAEGVGVRATGRLLGIGKDTVNRVILLAGEHCALMLSNLLTSLKMTEVQLDELWSFIKKREVLTRRMSRKNMAGHGFGRH